jgi:hypothetical protein
MEYIGKTIIKFRDYEVVGERYLMDIPEHLSEMVIKYGTEKELEAIKQTQVEVENHKSILAIDVELRMRKLSTCLREAFNYIYELRKFKR